MRMFIYFIPNQTGRCRSWVPVVSDASGWTDLHNAAEDRLTGAGRAGCPSRRSAPAVSRARRNL